MRRDDALLLDMLLACRKLLRFTQDLTEDQFESDELVQSAVMRELQVLGDASRLVTDATKTQYPAIPWRAIAGMRNRIVHAYFDVRLEVLWDTIQHEVPVLSHDLAQIVPLPETPDTTPGR